MGVADEQVDAVIGVIEENSQQREQYVNVFPPTIEPIGTCLPSPVRVAVGGAIIFVLPVDRFERV